MSNIISHLNIRKSTGPNRILTKVMKQIKDVISAPLAKLINRSFHNGVFPNILKIAKVIPISKSESRDQELSVTTIGQFPFFSILGR